MCFVLLDVHLAKHPTEGGHFVTTRAAAEPSCCLLIGPDGVSPRALIGSERGKRKATRSHYAKPREAPRSLAKHREAPRSESPHDTSKGRAEALAFVGGVRLEVLRVNERQIRGAIRALGPRKPREGL